MFQLETMVENLLFVLSRGFQILQPDKTIPLYTLHLNECKNLKTLIIVADLENDFRFPINLMRSALGIASCGDIYKSEADQFLIVTPISHLEYVVHAIERDRLLEHLSEWIVKNPVRPKVIDRQYSWDVLVPIFELESIAYKSFTKKIND